MSKTKHNVKNGHKNGLVFLKMRLFPTKVIYVRIFVVEFYIFIFDGHQAPGSRFDYFYGTKVSVLFNTGKCICMNSWIQENTVFQMIFRPTELIQSHFYFVFIFYFHNFFLSYVKFSCTCCHGNPIL